MAGSPVDTSRKRFVDILTRFLGPRALELAREELPEPVMLFDDEENSSHYGQWRGEYPGTGIVVIQDTQEALIKDMAERVGPDWIRKRQRELLESFATMMLMAAKNSTFVGTLKM